MVALPGPHGGLRSSVEPRGPGSLTVDRELTGPRPLQRLVRQLVDLFADCRSQISGEIGPLGSRFLDLNVVAHHKASVITQNRPSMIT